MVSISPQNYMAPNHTPKDHNLHIHHHENHQFYN